MSHCTSLALAFALGDAAQLAFGLRDTFAEPARSALIPLFKEAQERAIGWGAYGFSISGSGPTCFAICPTQEKAQRIAQGVKALMGPETRTYVVRPRLTGAEIIE
jgi:homoserine kinase